MYNKSECPIHGTKQDHIETSKTKFHFSSCYRGHFKMVHPTDTSFEIESSDIKATFSTSTGMLQVEPTNYMHIICNV